MTTNILVAYDSSELSEKAVEEAKRQAQLVENAVIHVVTVVSHGGPTTNAMLARSFMNDLAEEARPGLERIQNELEKEGLPCTSDVLLDYSFRNPGSKLVEYADENQIELIVLGSRGLGGVGKFLLGSVSSQIVQQAKCKVLILK
ncbi:universal stress protein [Gracilibacillus timonensis]|uniref:universal stress protein n=1 Tax=Gracilibacillus timonensis TaxID=1816696 RepID=UPI000824BE96|nr:universal stress protein [Gracilibacillus timonensis]